MTAQPVASFPGIEAPRVQAVRSRGLSAQTVALWLCCAYIVSQVYMVPIWLVGPSWSVWPSATDLIVPIMLLCLPFVHDERRGGDPEITTVKRYLLILAVGSILSYLGLTLNLLSLKTIEGSNDKGQYFGLYQIYRFGQFLVVFCLVSRLDFSRDQRLWLRRTIALTFWITCASILANYFDFITTPSLAPQIPRTLSIAGPWAFYSLGVVGKPVGAISFHHAYPAVQVLLLGATYICSLPSRRVWITGLILISLFACSLVSGSRAGFVAVCCFAVAMAASQPRQLLFLTAVAVLVAPVWLFFSDDLSGGLTRAFERQRSIMTSYDEDGLAGRVGIWNDRVELLNRDPKLWVLGTGYGSAEESGGNGHMLYLHITLECGVIGLAIFLALGQRITVFLWRGGIGARALCFATVGLMVSSFSQETFYPVPALGHFCGMYLFCVVIAIRHSAALSRRDRMKAF